MIKKQASITALVTAFVRAYHVMHDEPKIFDDFIADRFFTDQERSFFAGNLALALKFLDPELYSKCDNEEAAMAGFMRAHTAAVTLARSGYAEDKLKKYYEQGIRQYVLLGAGMDTFAFRDSGGLEGLRIFEVDYPATQEMKYKRLLAAGLKVPENLCFVPVDFEEGNLAEVLQKSGFRTDEPAFFSWLGVTYYLTIDAVFSTFGQVVRIAEDGSAMTFDYLEKEAFDSEKSSDKFKRVLSFMKNTGEPMISGFEPAGLKSSLAGMGLFIEDDLDSKDIDRKIIGVRHDGYRAPEYFHFATGRIDKKQLK